MESTVVCYGSAERDTGADPEYRPFSLEGSVKASAKESEGAQNSTERAMIRHGQEQREDVVGNMKS